MESLVSDIPAGYGNIEKLFLPCISKSIIFALINCKMYVYYKCTFPFSFFLDLQMPMESWIQMPMTSTDPIVIRNSQPSSHRNMLVLKL